MKSMVKILVTLSLLLPLTGCWKPSWFSQDAQKEVIQEPLKGHQATQQPQEHVCSHPGCKKNHGKNHKHHDEVEVQGIRIESEEVEIQALDENDFDEDFEESDYTI